jgi:hypothetical protein
MKLVAKLIRIAPVREYENAYGKNKLREFTLSMTNENDKNDFIVATAFGELADGVGELNLEQKYVFDLRFAIHVSKGGYNTQDVYLNTVEPL